MFRSAGTRTDSGGSMRRLSSRMAKRDPGATVSFISKGHVWGVYATRKIREDGAVGMGD